MMPLVTVRDVCIMLHTHRVPQPAAEVRLAKTAVQRRVHVARGLWQLLRDAHSAPS